ncbi:site-specific recombinase XerD [Evansella vedderi]|uniref:Site-specific recombinase XerD n=1 Tax=Evansella vedderi TaxID=38282 RepID=A0ABT9ZWM3_9BACI|nr:tyrosine-type recombinase/integrase [Evansella vedderi]MDQ0255630.1 site-specific recombinase XerD [Evansella vedderi]
MQVVPLVTLHKQVGVFGFEHLVIGCKDTEQKMKKVMVEPSHLSLATEMIDQNEREDENNPFRGFSDLGMIYYYVHKPTHADKDKNKKEDTVNEYLRDISQFYSQLLYNEGFMRSDVKDFEEGSLLKNLKKRHIRQYQEWLKTVQQRGKEGYSLATRSRKVTVLKGFLKWLHEVGYIKEPVYSAFLSNSLREKDRIRRDLSYEEVKQILNFYKDNPIIFAVLSVLATTGLRVQEIANAKWNDLYYDSDDKTYYLSVIGKNDKPRDAIIFDNVFERIQNFRNRRRLNVELDPADDSPLFTTKKGTAYDYKYLSVFVKKVIERTGLEFLKYKPSEVTPHHFRHFFAQYSAEQGASLIYIQRTLGHASYRTTEIYLEKDLKKKNNVARQWDESKF